MERTLFISEQDFAAYWSHGKTHYYAFDEVGFAVGDELTFIERDLVNTRNTGRRMVMYVSYLQRVGIGGQFVILSLNCMRRVVPVTKT